MKTPTSTPRPRHASRGRLKRGLLVPVTLALLALASGCGGGSSKPAYCSDRSALQDDVTSLTGSVTSGDVGSLSSQVSKIKTDATALVGTRQVGFPS